MKNLTEYTDRELLKVFSKNVKKYDSLRDDELNFIGDNPNREFWDDEQDKNYEELCDEIKAQYKVISDMIEFIQNLR